MGALTCRAVTVCETVMDHDYSGLTLTAAGNDPRRGPFHTYTKRCRKCGRAMAETRWLLPLEVALARVTVKLVNPDYEGE